MEYKDKSIIDQCDFRQGTLFELEYQFREYNIKTSKQIAELEERIKVLENKTTIPASVQIEVKEKTISEFLKELVDIKGIGISFAEDIINVFPNRELLINAINSNSTLPFNSKTCKLLREKYGVTK